MSATSLETTPAPNSPWGGDDHEEALNAFLDARARLFRIAYRVTGDMTGAEDVVQEAWLRWQRVDRSTINSPTAFLTTTTTHLAINVIQSARQRHETSSESPLSGVFEVGDGPERQLEQLAVVEEVLGTLMAKLSSSELAAYVLRKAFDYAYTDLADLLRTNVPNTRQLVRRAQTHVEGERRHVVSPERHAEVVAAFLVAARAGDFSHLEHLLAPDKRRVRRASRPNRRTARTDGTLPDAA